MARKPSPKPKRAVPQAEQKKLQSPSHQSIAQLDLARAAFDAAVAPYVPAQLPTDATRVGRPSSYRPEHCQIILDDAALGHTLGASAAIIGITRETLHQWASSFPEFSDAVTRAKSIRQRFYEGHLIDIARRGGDSTRMSAIKLGLLNTGGEDWKERLTAEHNVTFSWANLLAESLKPLDAPSTVMIEGEVVKPDEDRKD